MINKYAIKLGLNWDLLQRYETKSATKKYTGPNWKLGKKYGTKFTLGQDNEFITIWILKNSVILCHICVYFNLIFQLK